MDFETLKEIFVETLGTEEELITPDAKLAEDLNADSLDALELNMAIEEKCGKNIPDEELGKIKTVGDILALLAE